MPTYKPYVRNTACHSREIKVYSGDSIDLSFDVVNNKFKNDDIDYDYQDLINIINDIWKESK